MSEGLNKVLLVGNLGADPELRYTAAGQAVLNFRMATTESYLDREGNRQQRTDWHRVALWGKRGEALAQYLSCGRCVVVEGRLRTSSYEKDGQKRYSTEIVAHDIRLPSASPRSSIALEPERERVAGGATASALGVQDSSPEAPQGPNRSMGGLARPRPKQDASTASTASPP